MASFRERGQKVEVVIKRARVLDRPLYGTFESMEEARLWASRTEALLDRGIVPTEHTAAPQIQTIETVIDGYLAAHPVKPKFRDVLATIKRRVGDTPIEAIDADWTDRWIAEQKRLDGAAPATIRSKVSALRAACNWAIRKKLIVMADMPLSTLPDSYSQYSERDAAIAGAERRDTKRERRLDEFGKEESAIRAVIAKGVLTRKQRPFAIEDKAHVDALFVLAVETCMRLREMYTLEWHQVHLSRRAVWLSRTKNGDERQVALSSVAIDLFKSLPKTGPYVFPWWHERDWKNSKERDYALKMTSNKLSKLFAEIFEDAGCKDLTFHDLRHEGVSRLFERTTLTTEAIMKHTGHKTHSQLMRYLKLRESHMANQLW